MDINLLIIESASNMNFVILITVVVVIFAFLLLYLFIQNFTKQFNRFGERKQLVKEGKIEEAEKIEMSHSGELNAAIALALYLYQNQIHDIESFRLTIQKVSRNYSPWSSKIYGLRKFPKSYWK